MRPPGLIWKSTTGATRRPWLSGRAAAGADPGAGGDRAVPVHPDAGAAVSPAELVLANWEHPSSQKFSAAPPGRLELPARTPGFPDYSFALHPFNAERDVWPFDTGTFDLIISMEMLEHMLLDPCFLFREAHRVLAPGGRLVVTTPNVASREGVNLLLGNNAPYRFGPYSAHGDYGRHNREYVPRELTRLGEACGLATGQLTTHDVYPVYGDMAAIERLLGNDDLSLRGQTIFYEGVKDGRPFTAYPESLFDYQPPEHAAILRVRRADRAAGEIRLAVEVTNTGLYEWQPETTWLGIRWLERQRAVQPDGRMALPGALKPGETAVLEGALPDPEIASGFSLKLDMFHEGKGWFYGGTGDRARPRFPQPDGPLSGVGFRALLRPARVHAGGCCSRRSRFPSCGGRGIARRGAAPRRCGPTVARRRSLPSPSNGIRPNGFWTLC